jgi:K+-transporting ATPase KdpF subunit
VAFGFIAETLHEHRPADDHRARRAGSGQLGLHRRVDQAVNQLLGYIVAGVIALLATIYLVVAMLFPEKF